MIGGGVGRRLGHVRRRTLRARGRLTTPVADREEAPRRDGDEDEGADGDADSDWDGLGTGAAGIGGRCPRAKE